MLITKAIIPVAGYGTRFLPITKTINKSMLPVLNKPIVDYIVSDCETAGIKEIIFVILPSEQQIQNYYKQNQILESYLKERNALSKLSLINDIHSQAKFSYIKQPQNKRYGTAIPVLLAEPFIKLGENFLVLMGDDFIYHQDGSCETANLIKTHQDSKAEATVACSVMSKEQLLKYSVVTTNKHKGNLYFKSMIEKPKVTEITSNLGNISKYVFNYDIFAYIKRIKPNKQTGEYYLTDAVNDFAADRHKVAVHTVTGQYLDCGTLDGWLNANQIVAKAEGIL